MTDFDKALEIGRPPNVKKLFPNSRALIVSGKYIDRAMLKKGNAISIAANGRNSFVIRGALLAAQGANSAIIIEIAKSEGGPSAYCEVNFWNLPPNELAVDHTTLHAQMLIHFGAPAHRVEGRNRMGEREMPSLGEKEVEIEFPR